MNQKLCLNLVLIYLNLSSVRGVTITMNYFPPAKTLPEGFAPHPYFTIFTETLDPNSNYNLGVRCSMMCNQNPDCKMQTLDRETRECNLYASGELLSNPSGLPRSLTIKLKVNESEQQAQVQQNIGWKVLVVHQVGLFVSVYGH